MRFRNRITGLEVSTERQLGYPYERVDEPMVINLVPNLETGRITDESGKSDFGPLTDEYFRTPPERGPDGRFLPKEEEE